MIKKLILRLLHKISRFSLAADETKKRKAQIIFKGHENRKYDLLAQSIEQSGFQVIGINDQKIYLQRNDLKLTSDRFHEIFIEIFGFEIYSEYKWLLQKDQPFLVFDVGMNRAYASLYFAEDPRCVKVYGFEPVKETFEKAQENITLNPHLTDKVDIYNFGLGKTNETTTFYLPENCGDYSSSVNLQKTSLKKESIRSFPAEVRCASECFIELFSQMTSEEKKAKKILKIDVEGAEFDIFSNLTNTALPASLAMAGGG